MQQSRYFYGNDWHFVSVFKECGNIFKENSAENLPKSVVEAAIQRQIVFVLCQIIIKHISNAPQINCTTMVF